MSETENPSEIEAAATAAAEEAAANPEAPREDAPPAAPTPEELAAAGEKAAEEAAEKQAAKAAEPAKKSAKAGKGTKPNAAVKKVQKHLATKKKAADAIPRPDVIEPTEEEIAADTAKAEKAEAVAALTEEIAGLEIALEDAKAQRDELLATGETDDGRSHVERMADMKRAGKATRQRRVQDRLALLSQGAGKSPLDQAMGAKRPPPAESNPPDTE